MDVRCENFRDDQHGGLRGFCDLVIQSFIRILSCKLFVVGTREWIELPSRQYQTSTGAWKWAKTVDFTTRDGHDEFQTAALEAIREFRDQSKTQAEPVRSGAGS